jgi:hypothetical protein
MIQLSTPSSLYPFAVFLIEISTNASRIHLTDAHQMRVIYLCCENDYNSHPYILSFLVDLPCSIVPHAQAYAHIYDYL